ncbi:DUF3482 domain-containing protein [Entomomonas sp. E2T0]|uniref:DUF3482 domain-containing protein n=1 Tax=Entomomonas sp. E2T0 TaxID=2930213 RepID=UPI002228347B|nr:DUF3482 domain-containing protein [Entomomonas sp. E2T0]UYZ83149.1 DUF3482 domain-containing protein [Entomomonas sp. E2T0]
MTKPLVLALVGHTNVGKTSLLRTLIRDTHFGEVSHRPSTTRHVEGAKLLIAGKPLLELYDTPGLEDAIGLLDYCDQLAQGDRLDGPERIERFLKSNEAKLRFEQEAKVLRQLLQSDAGLYVIDAREPVLAKYKDELEILIDTGKPLLPVLNFVANNNHRTEEWRGALARLGLHALVQFDSVAPPEDGERRLYETLALLLEQARPQLLELIGYHEQQSVERYQQGLKIIAELLIDIAAYSFLVATDEKSINEAKQNLQDKVRKREQHCIESLLALYQFRKDDAFAGNLPLIDGRFDDDLFNPETIKQFSLSIGKGAAAGAVAGVGVDLMFAGLTLGAAALLGAITGSAWQTFSNYKDQLVGKFTGKQFLGVDDAILQILAIRQCYLLTALVKRGHAANQAIELNVTDHHLWKTLPKPLQKARAHQDWCSLLKGYRSADNERAEQIVKLANNLQEALVDAV